MIRTFLIGTFLAAVFLLANCPQRVSAQDAPGMAAEREFADGASWTLTEPMRWEIGSTDVVIEVPRGFVHDKASIPRPLWALLPKHGTYTRATVIHDYLYWTQLCTREQADNLLMIAMKESDVGWFRRRSIHRAVRVAGDSAWKANLQDRTDGKPRINPRDRFTGNLTWPQLRQQLIAQGQRDPPFDTRSDYCVFGNSTKVP